MCLKHTSDEELLKELEDRVNNDKIQWDINYFFDSNKTRMELRAEQQKFSLTFAKEINIENGVLCRNIYKDLESRLLKTQERKKESELEKVFELMKKRQKEK